LMPPFAVARLGASSTPVDAFDWVEDQATHGGGLTVIRPAISLRVLSDGSITPYLPATIFFRDGPGGAIRPTAPFFEVWAQFDGAGSAVPLTATLLSKLGGSLSNVTYRVNAANLKAARRTKDPACGFGAEVTVSPADPTPQVLLAASPNLAGSQPLVLPTAPIPLGQVQAIRPRPGTSHGVDLDVLRLRITPAAGEVFGPPSATSAPDPDAPPGSLAQYVIVPERNRILNQNASWPQFHLNNVVEQPEPADTFDGALDLPTGLGGLSWGVVDDTCDMVIEAVVTIGSDRFIAIARASAGPPDFAPDRRPFVSIADDLADRELPPLTAEEIADPVTVAEVADLLRRVFETVSLVNLDSLRSRMLAGQTPADPDPVPHTALKKSMTAEDRPLADQIPSIVGSGPRDKGLEYAEVAHDVHSELADIDNMIALFRTQGARIKHLLRPPFAHFADLPDKPVTMPPTDELGPDRTPVLVPMERDPRATRDIQHDMRMPPYMRDADSYPLSLTWRQYREVLDLIVRLQSINDQDFAALGPTRKHVARVVQRRQEALREQQTSGSETK
jgi:hypothetical protein